ncbi:MAG: hypothetical protein MSJ26_11430 [Oscillospiraceae bacterium]|nr:hypothetical protein [Oscillospiraceae bacterium]
MLLLVNIVVILLKMFLGRAFMRRLSISSTPTAAAVRPRCAQNNFA